MNKKILLVLLLAGVAVTYYSLSGEDTSFAEREATDENAKIAVEFTKFVYDYSQRKDCREFFRRFDGVPSEDQEYVWNTLKIINTLPEPSMVTVPALGDAKRYIYYNANSKRYCFTVSLIKKNWELKNVREIN